MSMIKDKHLDWEFCLGESKKSPCKMGTDELRKEHKNLAMTFDPTAQEQKRLEEIEQELKRRRLL